MQDTASHPFCIATIVTQNAIEAMLEGSGEGSYRDEHPWLVARTIFTNASSGNEFLPILFASKAEDEPAIFTHWSRITDIEVVELHRGQWDTRVRFAPLQTMNPIWQDIDSVFLQPSQAQLDRERLENVRVYRTALDEFHIHPYAICETPQFILGAV